MSDAVDQTEQGALSTESVLDQGVLPSNEARSKSAPSKASRLVAILSIGVTLAMLGLAGLLIAAKTGWLPDQNVAPLDLTQFIDPVLLFLMGALAASAILLAARSMDQRRQSRDVIEPLVSCLRAARENSALLLVEDMVPKPKGADSALTDLVREVEQVFQSASTKRTGAADPPGLGALKDEIGAQFNALNQRLETIDTDRSLAAERELAPDEVANALQTLAASLDRIETVIDEQFRPAMSEQNPVADQLGAQITVIEQTLATQTEMIEAQAQRDQMGREGLAEGLKALSQRQTKQMQPILNALDGLSTSLGDRLSPQLDEILAHVAPTDETSDRKDLEQIVLERLGAIENVVDDELGALSRNNAERDNELRSELTNLRGAIEGVAASLADLPDVAPPPVDIETPLAVLADRFDTFAAHSDPALQELIDKVDGVQAGMSAGFDGLSAPVETPEIDLAPFATALIELDRKIGHLSSEEGVLPRIEAEGRALAKGMVTGLHALAGKIDDLSNTKSVSMTDLESGVRQIAGQLALTANALSGMQTKITSQLEGVTNEAQQRMEATTRSVQKSLVNLDERLNAMASFLDDATGQLATLQRSGLAQDGRVNRTVPIPSADTGGPSTQPSALAAIVRHMGAHVGTLKSIIGRLDGASQDERLQIAEEALPMLVSRLEHVADKMREQEDDALIPSVSARQLQG